MDREKLNEDARLATSIYLMAQERIQSISAMDWALQKILAAYEGSDTERENIQNIIDVFIQWKGDRVEQLKPIERTNRNEASRLTDLLSNGGD